jgi:LuxR family maltose regulon positive regulatory protein
VTTPLLKTKLYIPPVRPAAQRVGRPNLIERLDAGLRPGHKLILVSAPAGSGKTTLLSEWVAGCEPYLRVAWVSLEDNDSDPMRFWTYCIAALQASYADLPETVGQAALAMLRSSQPTPIEAVLTVLINEVASIPEGNRQHRLCILVLDDYHVIGTQAIHDALAFLLDHLPPHMHLVIASRSDPPLPLSRLRGRSQLAEVRTADLRFTSDEASAFLNHVMGLALSEEDVSALAARTEGWIVGLQLAALSLRGLDAERVAGSISALTGSQRHILDYLLDEVFSQQPESVQTFLRRTSILDRLTGSLCDAVCGAGRGSGSAELTTSGQHMLRQLESANLFVVPLDDGRRWYRYHHLFADFLRTELDVDSQADLHLKAARWLADHGLLSEAVKHTLASGNMDEAARVIALAAEGPWIVSYVTFLSWLNALPDDLVRANGELATYKGILLFMTRQHADAAVYAAAAARSLSPDAPPSSRGRLQCLNALLALGNGQWDAAIESSKEALDSLGGKDTFFRSITLSIQGQVLQMQGDFAGAVDVYRDAVLTGRQAGDHLGAMLVLINLVFALNEIGRRREAIALCQQTVEGSTAQPGSAPSLSAIVYCVWSLLSYEANEIDLACEQVLRALDTCQRMSFTDGVFLSYYVLALVHLSNGEIDAIRKTSAQVRQYAARMDLDLPYEPWLAALEAQASLNQGDLGAATRWAEAAKLAPTDAPSPFLEAIYFVYVRVLLAQNRVQDARTLLATMERSAQEGGRHRKSVTIYLQQALVQQTLGHQAQSLVYLKDALHLAAPEAYIRAFLDEGQAIVDLLSLVRHIAPGFVDQVLNDASAAGIEPVVSQVPRAQALVEPLSERELQVLRLLAAGLTSTEVARELYIAVGTARTHIKNIYGKLGVHGRVEAVIRAQEFGLV